MARRWLRGPYPELSGPNYHQSTRGCSILLYFYFRYLLGYQFLDENATGFTFNGCESDSNTDGSLSNTNQRFTAASASFIAGDVNKFIVILDTANEVNCGIYKITNWVDANNVDIDFYSPDNPTTTGATLSWWLVDSTIGASMVDGDNIVFRVNHAVAPYEFALRFLSHAAGWGRLLCEVAVEAGSWTVGVDWAAGAKLLRTTSIQAGRGYVGGDTSSRLYAYGDTDGSLCFLGQHTFAGTGILSINCFGVYDVLFETSPARLAVEKVFSYGPNSAQSAVETWRNGRSDYGFDYGGGWSASLRDGAYDAVWCGFRDSSDEYFKRSVNQPNHRDGAEFDGMGIWCQIDQDVSNNPVWSLIGQIPKDHLWLGSVLGIGDRVTFGSDAYMHWRHGVVTPWPGVRFWV